MHPFSLQEPQCPWPNGLTFPVGEYYQRARAGHDAAIEFLHSDERFRVFKNKELSDIRESDTYKKSLGKAISEFRDDTLIRGDDELRIATETIDEPVVYKGSDTEGDDEAVEDFYGYKNAPPDYVNPEDYKGVAAESRLTKEWSEKSEQLAVIRAEHWMFTI